MSSELVGSPCEALNESFESLSLPSMPSSSGPMKSVRSLSSRSSPSPWGVASMTYESFGSLGVGIAVSEYEAGSGGGNDGEDS
ncbi:unnamed protein product [Phytophthora lilii]|uniref:Unnamed protein product n=1 Tax=Phytophthora lilii TaxID=2077276 RepID=A0A9W6XFT0_9STRA|nr:unnamed protein product [Phytophthora lilii]